MDTLPDPTLPQVLVPSAVAEDGYGFSFSSGARLYTLFLATIAGAGIALAVVLIFCVVKSHLEFRRQRRRSDAFTSIMLSHGRHAQRSRWETTRHHFPLQSSVRDSPGRATMGPFLPWEDIASIITEIHAGSQPQTASTSMPAEAVQTLAEPREEDDKSETTEQAGDQAEGSSLGARSVSSVSLSTEQLTAEHADVTSGASTQSEHLNRHLEKLLQHIGGEAVLMEVTSLDAMQRNLRPLFGMDFLDVEGLALRTHRLHIAAVAACGLRMAALSQVEGIPGLAGLPAPWSSEYLELVLELSKRDGAETPCSVQGVPSSSRAAEGSSSSRDEPDSHGNSPAEEALHLQEEVWFEAEEGPTPEKTPPHVMGQGCAEPDHVAIEIDTEKEVGNQHAGMGRSSRAARAPGGSEVPSTSGSAVEADRRQRGWLSLMNLAGRVPSPDNARLEAQGGCIASFTMGGILRSPDSQPQRMYLQGGSHIGFSQTGLLRGERLRICHFKPTVQKQLMRLCTLLEANQHPAVCGPCALCTVPSWEAAIIPVPDSNTLEDVLACSADRGLLWLPWRARLAVAYDLVMGLHHLHNKWDDALVHGSIHPSNVLISPGFHASLSEPGFLPASLTLADNTIHEAGPAQLRGPTSLMPGLMPLIVDFAYLDPQYQKRGQFTPPADVYALGVVLLKLLTGLPAKGIVTVVREAYRQEMLEDVLDPQAGDWPPAVAQTLVEVALACSERRHTRRCKLETNVIYQLQGLLLDSFRVILCESGIMQAVQPDDPANDEDTEE